MNNQFDWRLIPSFLAALDQGSLLGASRMLKATQPTVGRHIAELESQLGVVLFERTGRGLLPTPMALQLAGAARAMEGSANQFARYALGVEEAIAGTVRISASTPVACYLLPPILAQMRQALPDVQVELVSSNQVSNLLRREADIALRMVQPDQASLVVKRIAKIPLGPYAHRDYLRRRGTPKKPEDLVHHELIGHDRDDAVIKGFAAFGVKMTKESFAFRCDDMIAYWQAVRAGLGIGFVADYVAAADKDVVAVLPMLKIPPMPIWLTVHREIRTSVRIRAVYDFLAQAVGKAV
ncbi:MAG: LysR family transcriptional regulator [Polaromonas sp.]|uniref:LysR family transcriptional regulator n=1 Tax=Polaromonas sp. TaxID=1869339 RepID=UPI0032630087